MKIARKVTTRKLPLGWNKVQYWIWSSLVVKELRKSDAQFWCGSVLWFLRKIRPAQLWVELDCGNDASKHFLEKHQKCEAERSFLEDAIKARRNCLPKISKIKGDIESGCNVAMAINQLQLITSELTNHMDSLDAFDKGKLLPPSIYRKSKEMCHALNETIKSVDIIIK